MNSLFNHAPAMYGSVMFHLASMLPRLREIGTLDPDLLSRVAEESGQISMEFPLHLATDKDRFDVPSWSKEKLSGMQVVSLMVGSLWVMCNEDETRCAPLVEKWPIKEACVLCEKPTTTTP